MSRPQEGRDRRPPLSRRQLTTVLRVLSSLRSGSLTVSVNRLPMLQADSESRSLRIEAAGVRESGLRLGEVLVGSGEEKSVGKLLASSEAMARALFKIGWTLTLYDGGSDLVSMGSGVSKLTGHIKANPLKLRKLLKTLR